MTGIDIGVDERHLWRREPMLGYLGQVVERVGKTGQISRQIDSRAGSSRSPLNLDLSASDSPRHNIAETHKFAVKSILLTKNRLISAVRRGFRPIQAGLAAASKNPIINITLADGGKACLTPRRKPGTMTGEGSAGCLKVDRRTRGPIVWCGENG